MLTAVVESGSSFHYLVITPRRRSVPPKGGSEIVGSSSVSYSHSFYARFGAVLERDDFIVPIRKTVLHRPSNRGGDPNQ